MGQFRIVWPIPRLGEVVLIVKLLAIGIWQYEYTPAMHESTIFVSNIGRRKRPIDFVVVIECQLHLIQQHLAGGSRRGPSQVTDLVSEPHPASDEANQGDDQERDAESVGHVLDDNRFCQEMLSKVPRLRVAMRVPKPIERILHLSLENLTRWLTPKTKESCLLSRWG